jgi:hypothetical protein
MNAVSGPRFAAPSLADDRSAMRSIRYERMIAAHAGIAAALSELADLGWLDVASEHYPQPADQDCEHAESRVQALQAAIEAFSRAVAQ